MAVRTWIPALILVLVVAAAITIKLLVRRRAPMRWPGVLDNPRAVSRQPPAAKVLTALLDKLHSVGAQSRRGRLAVVRTLTERGGA